MGKKKEAIAHSYPLRTAKTKPAVSLDITTLSVTVIFCVTAGSVALYFMVKLFSSYIDYFRNSHGFGEYAKRAVKEICNNPMLKKTLIISLALIATAIFCLAIMNILAKNKDKHQNIEDHKLSREAIIREGMLEALQSITGQSVSHDNTKTLQAIGLIRGQIERAGEEKYVSPALNSSNPEIKLMALGACIRPQEFANVLRAAFNQGRAESNLSSTIDGSIACPAYGEANHLSSQPPAYSAV